MAWGFSIFSAHIDIRCEMVECAAEREKIQCSDPARRSLNGGGGGGAILEHGFFCCILLFVSSA